MKTSIINNMKNLVYLFAIVGLFLFASCEDADNLCLGEPNQNIACLDIYEPVCGCDGITYGNECEATRAGVLSWKNRKCLFD